VEARQAETDQKVSGMDVATANREGREGAAAERHHRRAPIAQH